MTANSSKIWYVEFPTYQYKEDVQALAKKAGAKIIDARFDAGDGSELPTLTKKDDNPKVAETPETETLYDVYKVVDGERAKRVSRGNLTKADAEEWVKGRDDEYVIVESD